MCLRNSEVNDVQIGWRECAAKFAQIITLVVIFIIKLNFFFYRYSRMFRTGKNYCIVLFFAFVRFEFQFKKIFTNVHVYEIVYVLYFFVYTRVIKV